MEHQWLSAQVNKLEEDKFIELYIGGLHDVNPQEVKVRAPKTMNETIQVAKCIEAKLWASKKLFQGYSWELWDRSMTILHHHN